MDDEDPEQLAREAIVELQGALDGLDAIREMLTLSRSGKAGTRSTGRGSTGTQSCGPARDHRR